MNDSLIRDIRSYYPHAKIALTVHCQQWIWPFRGDLDFYKKVITKKAYYAKYPKYKSMIDLFEKEKGIYEEVDSLICLSKDTFNLVHELYGIPSDKMALIPNGLRDTSKKIRIKTKENIRRCLFIRKDEIIFLYVGRLDELKGIHVILNSFSKLLESHPSCRLVIAGAAGDFTIPLNYCKKTGTRVTFTGKLSQKELAQWYSIADIGLVVSYGEQCSYTGIEMLMHGLPIIASDGVGVRCMFEENINAKVISIGNVKSPKTFVRNLLSGMTEMVTNEKERLELGKKARSLYQKSYVFEKMRHNYHELFRSFKFE